MVGEVLSDRYEVEELVGTGGMSSVFRAHDRLLDRKVALKVLHQHYSEDEEYIERFRREARAVAALSHPNIVTVIDRGEHDGRQFIVFEYIDGENLKALIQRRGPAPVTTALDTRVAFLPWSGRRSLDAMRWRSSWATGACRASTRRGTRCSSGTSR